LWHKHEVYTAYKQVKVNKGAAGVDWQTIANFEIKLEDNLYKLWNRLPSGSYFPPPVKRVEIPKEGGTRLLGIYNCDTLLEVKLSRPQKADFQPDSSWVEMRQPSFKDHFGVLR
jgi:RNA-directed DNA polymerase